MAQPAYTEVVALEACKNGEALATYHQLEFVAEQVCLRTRKFCSSRGHGSSHRSSGEHQGHPLALPGGLSSNERKVTASAHLGLRGTGLTAVIAGVSFDDVPATAERRRIRPT